jgi:alkanesulfonate monooxygenase SsuD/methylene tetrahydromethanopterin reductase-like flavin-dependent oxidoreductase (luciferase family)
VAGEAADGLMLHSLTSPEYIRDVVRPALADGAERSGRDADKITVSGGGFLITGPNKQSLRAAQAEVRRRIAFYASTRTYHSVLAPHGFEEIGQRLHEMSLRGEWAEMGELVSDEMLHSFAVSGEYDEIAGEFARRYGGLVDEASFTLYSEKPLGEPELRRIVRDFREL